MKTTLALTAVALILVVLVGAVTLSQTAALGPTAGASSPVEAAQSFYDWYLDYVGYQPDGTFRNAMVDGAYRTNPDLAPEFVAQIDDLLASFKGQGGGYDPFLCAQDIPTRVTVGGAQVSGEQATVTVSTFWMGNPMAHRFEVALELREGAWKIVDIRCGAGSHKPLDARETAQAFYDLYLQVAEQRNPLANGLYRDLPFLAPEFVQQVDEILAGFERGGYDPFLCAQDVPSEVLAQAATVDGDTATVTMSTSFEGHGFTVDLRAVDGQWLVAGVNCQGK
jgi:hypothetical protein